MSLISSIVLILLVYVVFGLLAAIAIMLKGLAKIDPSTEEATRGFRFLIFPGIIALWPLLITRWIKSSKA